MNTVPISLKYQSHPVETKGSSFERISLFIESNRTEQWLDVVTRYCPNISKCDMFRWQSTSGPQGVFVRLPQASKLLSSLQSLQSRVLVMMLVESCDGVGEVWIPIQSKLSPSPSKEEWRDLIHGCGLLVWHPSYGLVELAEEDRIDWRELFESPEVSAADWNQAVEAELLPERLLMVRPMTPPSMDAWIVDDPIGTESSKLRQLPPAQSERRGQWLRNTKDQLRSVLGRVVESLLPKPQTSTHANKPGPSTGQGALSHAAWVQSMRAWATKLSKSWSDTIQARREASIERLMELLRKNPDQGLKYAIPLTGDESNRGLAAAGSSLLFRDWFGESLFSRLSGGADCWHLSLKRRMELHQRYHELAREHVDAGRFRKGACIYIKLLGDYQAAAAALEKGAYYRDAALIYRDKLRNQPLAAEMFRKAGDLHEAIRILETNEMFLQAGMIYRDMGDESNAVRCFEIEVDRHIKQGRIYEASEILLGRLNRREQAISLLEAHWLHPTASERYVGRVFELLAEEGKHTEVKIKLDRFVQQLTSFPKLTWPLSFLAKQSQEYPVEEIRESCHFHLMRVASEILVSDMPESRKVVVTSNLREASPRDRLLLRDTMEFNKRCKSQGSKTGLIKNRVGPIDVGRLVPSRSYQLANPTNEWLGLIQTSQGCDAIGIEGRDLLFFRFAGPTAERPTVKTRRVRNVINRVPDQANEDQWMRLVRYGHDTYSAFSIAFIKIAGSTQDISFLTKSSATVSNPELGLTMVAPHVLDCCSIDRSGLPHTVEGLAVGTSRSLAYLTSEGGRIRLMSMATQSEIDGLPFVDHFLGSYVVENDEQLVGMVNGYDNGMIDETMIRMLLDRWRMAISENTLLLSCGRHLKIYESKQLVQSFEKPTRIESMIASAPFSRPRAIVVQQNQVDLQLLKLDKYRSVVLLDDIEAPRADFLGGDKIGIVHADGVDVLTVQGHRVIKRLSHSSSERYLHILRDQRGFYTLTESGLVEFWATPSSFADTQRFLWQKT